MSTNFGFLPVRTGKRWEKEITNAIHGCDAVILFATKTLFAAEDPYVVIECQIAEGFNKDIYVVWMDIVALDDVNISLKAWYFRLTALQGIQAAGCTVDKTAWSILHELPLTGGLPPRPTIPIYEEQKKAQEKAAPKPEPAPVQTQAVSRPDPKPVVVTETAVPATAKGEGQPATSVWIAAVAIVLVAAIARPR